MPFVGRSVEPEHIRKGVLRKTQVTLGGEHEALVNGSLAQVLRQLADLSAFVEGIFHELLEESASVVARADRLKRRVRAIADKTEHLRVLDTPLPESSLVAAAEQGARRCAAAYRAAERCQECRLFTVRSRPPCVRALHAGAAPAVLLPCSDRAGGGGGGGRGGDGSSGPSTARRRSLLESDAGSSVACWQQSLEPVFTKPWPTVVTLPVAKLVLPQQKYFRRSAGALRKPRCTVTRDAESAADLGRRDSVLYAKSQSSLSSTALVAVNTSSEAFERLAASRAVSRNGARSNLKRRLTLSGLPAELAGLRSNTEASLRLTAVAAGRAAPPVCRHLDLQPSAIVSSKNPDAYVVDDDGAPDERLRAGRRQQSLIGRWLQRSRSLPRDFGRRRGGETADGSSSLDRSGSNGRLTLAGGTNGTLVDDRLQKVFVNFYGEPMSPVGAVGKPRGTVTADEVAALVAAQRKKLDGAARVKSRSYNELSRVSSSLRSKPSRSRSASAERPRYRERFGGADSGESFLSHTLPCLFRRKTSSDEETIGAPTVAGGAGRRASSARGVLSGSSRSSSSAAVKSRRVAPSQLLANVTLRKRDSKATTMSNSSGRWSGSDRYSFGSDCNVSSADSHPKLCSSRVSVDHDSAVCMDGSSRGDSRLGGSSDMTGATADAPCGLVNGRCLASFNDDEIKDSELAEPLFILQADSEVLSLYSVDQDGFYTTMHSDSCLREKGRSDDSDVGAAELKRTATPSLLRQAVRLCDGAAQTDVTFAGSEVMETDVSFAGGHEGKDANAMACIRKARQLSDACVDASGQTSSLLAGGSESPVRPPDGRDCSGVAESPAAYGVQLFHSLVPVTLDSSDEDDLQTEDTHRGIASKQTAAAVPTDTPAPAIDSRELSEAQKLQGDCHSPACRSAPSDDAMTIATVVGTPLSIGPPLAVVPERTQVARGSNGSPSRRACEGPSKAAGNMPLPGDRPAAKLSSDASLPISGRMPLGSCEKPRRPLPPVRQQSRQPPCSDAACDPSRLPVRGAAADVSDRSSLTEPLPANSGLLGQANDVAEQQGRSPSAVVRQLDEDGEIGADEFPLMKADAEALNVATARCLSVLATQFKVKDGNNPLLSACSHRPTLPSMESAGCSAPVNDASNPGRASQVSSLIEQARRMSVYNGLAGADEDGTLFTSASSTSAASVPVVAIQPSMSRSCCSSRRSAPSQSVQSATIVQGMGLPSHYPHMRSSRSSGCLGEGKLQQQHRSPSALPVAALPSCRPEAKQSYPSAGMNAADAGRIGSISSVAAAASPSAYEQALGVAGAFRTVSYRIANGRDEVNELPSGTGRRVPPPRRMAATEDLGRREATPPKAAAVQPPPPRALSYRVANDTDQLCAPDGSAAERSSGSGRMLHGGSSVSSLAGGSRANVREFMKGIYENSEIHLPPLPVAPVSSELVCITKPVARRCGQTSRGGATATSVESPASAATVCPSTFLPGDECSTAVCLQHPGAAESAAMEAATSYSGWAELELPYSLVPGTETVAARGPQPRSHPAKERPRSSIMTKGDRRELEWMQSNFAALLQRCFNEDDVVYASLEALRQDESSLQSLMDSVQKHSLSPTSATTAAVEVASPAIGAASDSSTHPRQVGSGRARASALATSATVPRPFSLNGATVTCTQTEV